MIAPTEVQAAVLPTMLPITDATLAPIAQPLPIITPIPIPTGTPAAATIPLAERRRIFEDVWRTVRENYLYPDFRGVDWNMLHDEYETRIVDAESREAFYSAMVEFVEHLDDNHSRFVPPAAVQAENVISNNVDTKVGIGIIARPKNDGALIQLVLPDSPAAKADLRARDRIIAVDGRGYQSSDGDLQGDLGSRVRLTIVRPGEKSRDVVLVRQSIEDRILPYYRRFPGDIGYVAIPTLWVNDMGDQVSGALTDMVASGPLHGIILDVRSNRGGWGEVLSDVLSHFVRGQAGVFFGRRYTRPLVVPAPAGPDLRNLPLVVLVDNDTASYAEVLAAVLRLEAGATIVGMRSAGNTETIYAHPMRDGSRLWLAQESFRLQDGTNLEGTGLEPDVQIDIDWTRYSEDDDPQLLEALRLLGGGPK